jgi:uroporphyrinogen-III synthase
MEDQMKSRGLAGLRVASFESRRSAEMARLIANNGGEAIAAPSMREVPLESNTEALAFARMLVADSLDMVIFLTGVGTRTLVQVVETIYPRGQFVQALRRLAVVARGPKPIAALRELGVEVTLAVPEPNTWRDLLRSLDERTDSLPLNGRRVAIQEYGSSNAELLQGLAARGAQITRVPVYRWALPEDIGPLRAAIRTMTRGDVDIALFTTSIQVVHLLKVAAEMNLEADLRRAFARIVIGSIGPMTTGELGEQGLAADFEPAHPKMGLLVHEAAQRGGELLREKRNRGST